MNISLLLRIESQDQRQGGLVALLEFNGTKYQLLKCWLLISKVDRVFTNECQPGLITCWLMTTKLTISTNLDTK